LTRVAAAAAGALVAAATLAAACGKSPPPQIPAPRVEPATTVAPPVSPWPGTLLLAQRSVDAGDYAQADRVLQEFAVSHPGSAEGAEADFFRALFKADPANASIDYREQVGAVESYLAGGPALPRYHEAIVLRRLIDAVDSARTQTGVVRRLGQERERSRDEEIRKLTDRLEKTEAELERIKRRLAKP
jgi:hypothetical protein